MVVVVVVEVVVVDDVVDVVVSKKSSGSSWSSSKVLPIVLGLQIDRFSVVSSITVQLYCIYQIVKVRVRVGTSGVPYFCGISGWQIIL